MRLRLKLHFPNFPWENGDCLCVESVRFQWVYVQWSSNGGAGDGLFGKIWEFGADVPLDAKEVVIHGKAAEEKLIRLVDNDEWVMEVNIGVGPQ